VKNDPIHALIFAPHPADPDFGIGGTAAKWVREGKQVVYVICTNGNTGTSDPSILPEEMTEIREQEQTKAAGILGINKVIFLGHQDLGLEYTPGLKKDILKLILTYRPMIVATCDPYNRKYMSNPDHRVLGMAVMDVVWPMCLAPNSYRDLIAEGLQMHKVQEMLLWETEEPTRYNDISDVYDLKMKAVNCHQSQIGPDGNAPDFPDMLKEMATTAGKAIGCQWGEAFHQTDVLQRL
jgi:LmbE family N-acetylglucosaminyl deacetylase